MSEESERDLRRELEALRNKARGVFGHGAGNARPGEGVSRVSGEGRRQGLGGSVQGAASRSYGRPGGQRVRGPSGPLDALVPGEAFETGSGALWRVRAEARAIWPEADGIYREYLEALESPAQEEVPCSGMLEGLRENGAGGTCYLDLETTGLKNAPLFLVGLLYSEEGSLIVDQLFARDYTEERAVVELAGDLISRFGMMVTFNGERFDMPFLADRMAYSGLEYSMTGSHLDLLPLSRSILAGRTPNHKLQTLERFVLGRKRVGDIPGSEIPPAYHEFVRTGDAADMAAVIHHNRLDLLSMVQLVTLYLSRTHERS